MRITGRRKTTSHALKKQGPGKNSACPLISSRSPHTRSDQSEPTFAGIRPTDVREVLVARSRLVRTNPAQSSVLDYFTRARHLPRRETLGNKTLIHISSFYSSREE